MISHQMRERLYFWTIFTPKKFAKVICVVNTNVFQWDNRHAFICCGGGAEDVSQMTRLNSLKMSIITKAAKKKKKPQKHTV